MIRTSGKRVPRYVATLLALGMATAACGSASAPGRLARVESDLANQATNGASRTSDPTPSAGGDAEDVLNVAFVYIGSSGDAGWTKRHDDGAKALEEAFGDRVSVTRVESVPEGDASIPVFQELAKTNDLIFGTSFGYGDPMLSVAADNPDTCFQHVSGSNSAPNMGNYFGAAEEGRYLTGIAAARASSTGKLGYVAAFPIPEVIRGINAFTLGAQSVNPNAVVEVEWTFTWFDPTVERTAAEKLLDAGADVLTQHQDTPATGEAAAARGAKWIGYHDDGSRFVPDAWLTGAMWNWGPHTISVAESVVAGTCPTESFYGTLADGTVTLASFGSGVDSTTKEQIATAQDEIIAGTLEPFAGPIKDQAGTIRIPAGNIAPLADLLGMDYFVKGVIGEIPVE